MTKPKKKAKARTSRRTTKPKKPKEPSVLDAHKARAKDDLVVFAIRLTEPERQLIHRASGPGKASRFVRAVAIAAAKGDETTIRQILKERQTTSE